jgi:hypothetical protein
MIVMHVSDPQQVASASSFEVLLGDPAVRLMIFSGIAIPERHVNDDDHTYPDTLIVKLGVSVSEVVTAVSHIGLASIANAETAFTFATDSGTVEIDPSTSELQLRVESSLRGEESYLHRFGYQVVAHVKKVSARIAGTITVPRSILDLTTLQPVEIAAQFAISANTVTLVSDPNGIFANWERLTPVAWGQVGETRSDDDECFVDYTIDGCPFNTPLTVNADVASGSQLQSHSAISTQTAGPRPVLLTNTNPEVDGVDFLISQLIIR